MRWTSVFVGVLLFFFLRGRPRGEERSLGCKLCRAALSEPCRLEASAHRAFWRSGAPPLDEVLVGDLGASRDAYLLFTEFLDVVGIGRSAPVALLLGSPRLQLHAADFVCDQGRPRPEVVDILRQQMPAQDRELACQRDGGDLMPALRSNP